MGDPDAKCFLQPLLTNLWHPSGYLCNYGESLKQTQVKNEEELRIVLKDYKHLVGTIYVELLDMNTSKVALRKVYLRT